MSRFIERALQRNYRFNVITWQGTRVIMQNDFRPAGVRQKCRRESGERDEIVVFETVR